MVFNEKDICELKYAMIKKWGKTSQQKLADEMGVSRTAINNAINNYPSLDKLRIKIKEWMKNC